MSVFFICADTAIFAGASIYSTLYLDGSQTAAEEVYPIPLNVLDVAHLFRLYERDFEFTLAGTVR